jgi:pyruvate-ferredoxin/flavodoxin oxidoreductase
MTDAEAEQHPDFKLIPMTGMPGYKFGITVSALDCLGCQSCVQICPGKKGEKALSMAPIDGQLKYQNAFDASYKYADNKEVLAKFKPETVKGSQFKQPLLEFSGACAGCGETPYAKLITQLFGDRMFIANATGCSSIWGGSAPSMPYTVNKDGHGPAWANSLFEDNAEFGLGMATAVNSRRNRLAAAIAELAEKECADEAAREAAKAWLENKDDPEQSKLAGEQLVKALEACGCSGGLKDQILSNKDLLGKKSIWIFGGDGWAYDIGFGGLDHAIASGEDINIFVFDTEVYSNTGGQASKSTPTGSVAKFAAAGKSVKKKDLAAIAMSYGYVYVAQVAMGADYNQCIKAITEAEKYKGPSLVIGYAPCINHGIKKGLGTSMLETKAAVAAGYWFNFRYNPELAAEGKNPFVLDSKEPTTSYKDFIKTETRYSSLGISFPERAEKLFDTAEQQAKDKYAALKKKAEAEA